MSECSTYVSAGVAGSQFFACILLPAAESQSSGARMPNVWNQWRQIHLLPPVHIWGLFTWVLLTCIWTISWSVVSYRASTRSAPVTGWSEQCRNDPMLILFSVCASHVPKGVEPSCVNTVGNWRTADSLSDSSVGNMSGLQNLEDFTKRPCVRSVQSPS